MLPEPELLFGRFEMDAGTKGGARNYFQLFITDLVKVQYPLATTVEGSGGRDWGIDTFVGELRGDIFVWQSKFILRWDDEGPQNQVRASFNHAIKKAAEKGHRVKVWTLCVPCNLEPGQHRWFTGWAKRMKAQHGTEVLLLNGTDLRGQLMREDARDVRREYFPHTMSTAEPLDGGSRVERVATAVDHTQFDGALFVKQLHAAGHMETDAARGLFFATEALFRDYTAKGDEASLNALEELHLDIQEVWEHAFNQSSPSADAEGRIAGLIETVMDRAAGRPDPAHLALRPAHKKGAAHRLVEAAHAGWVNHWRAIASEHARTEPRQDPDHNSSEQDRDPVVSATAPSLGAGGSTSEGQGA